MRNAMMGAMLASLAAGAVAAKPALRDVPEIDDGLFVVGLAHEIRKNCPSIEARLFKAFGFLRGLERDARDLGYTEDEIRTHLKSKAEKKRLRARAAQYMEAQGFGQDKAGYCALGKAEIARASEIGALLRASK
ncbi:MAG: DUF5333 domain-containing protein [Pseudomonadota bacterium]